MNNYKLSKTKKNVNINTLENHKTITKIYNEK